MMNFAWPLFFVIAVLAAWISMSRRASAIGIASRANDHLLIAAVLGGILGSRIKWLMDFWPGWALDQSGALLPWHELVKTAGDLNSGGAVLYGGIILGGVFALVTARMHRIPLSCAADLAAPSVLIGIACGRIGCFFNGCCWGSETHLPWGVSPSQQAMATGVSPMDKLHPTVLYESIFAMIFACVLIRAWRLAWTPNYTYFETPAHSGRVASIAVLGYSVWRFGIEFLRGDTHRQVEWLLFGSLRMTSSQVTSLVLIVAVAIWWAAKSWRPQRVQPSPL